MTVLHYAAKRRDLNMVKYLLSFSNIDLYAKDNNNHTILHYAALNTDVEVIKYLYSTFNLSMNAKDNYGKNPFDCVPSNNNNNFVKKYISQILNIEWSPYLGSLSYYRPDEIKYSEERGFYSSNDFTEKY